MKRYDFYSSRLGAPPTEEESADGDWVRFQDAAIAVALERERCAKWCERMADEADERRPLDGSVGEALRSAAARMRAP